MPALQTSMRYQKVKYVLTSDLVRLVPQTLPPVESPLGSLQNVPEGTVVTVKKGFAWDGASGPCPDKWTMVASCCHDLVYALIRNGSLPDYSKWAADDMFYTLAKRGGTPRWVAWLSWKVLLLMGRWALRHPHKVHEVAA